jgi:hypothetical protein
MSRFIVGPILLGSLLLTPTAMAQTRTPFQAGVHWGFNFSDGEVDDERIGLQASVPVIWRLTINPVFSYLYNFPGDPSGFFEGSAWQGYLTLRVPPFGKNPFLALGYGITLAHASLRIPDLGVSDSETDATDVGVIAVTLPKGRVRPFAEVYLVDLLERRASVGGNLLVGANLRIP